MVTEGKNCIPFLAKSAAHHFEKVGAPEIVLIEDRYETSSRPGQELSVIHCGTEAIRILQVDDPLVPE